MKKLLFLFGFFVACKTDHPRPNAARQPYDVDTAADIFWLHTSDIGIDTGTAYIAELVFSFADSNYRTGKIIRTLYEDPKGPYTATYLPKDDLLNENRVNSNKLWNITYGVNKSIWGCPVILISKNNTPVARLFMAAHAGLVHTQFSDFDYQSPIEIAQRFNYFLRQLSRRRFKMY